jgi:uncharacterized protein YebE (UPF0316 family)
METMVGTILGYLLITFAKVIEVSLMTVRVVLVTRGEKVVGSIIGFFEVMLWLFIASTVIKDINSDPFKAVFYALGFALGNFFGIKVEAWIGLGVSQVQVIIKEGAGNELIDYLRECGYGVTVVKGEGKNSTRDLLFMFVKRKKIGDVVSIIKEKQNDSVITISETKPVYGGYGLIRK